MISFLKLIRYPNLLMVLLTLVLTKYALIHSFTSPSYFTTFQFTLLVTSILCITAGGYIVNDIYDVEADKINKPSKVFIGKSISIKNAWIGYGITTVIGLALGVYASFQSGNNNYSFLFIFTSIGLYLYSKYFKRIAFIGNLMISSFIALSIYLISLFEYPPESIIELIPHIESPRSAILFYVKFSFITTLIREMIKDQEDIVGDYNLKMKTLPILIGRQRTNEVIIFFTCILLFFLIREIYTIIFLGSVALNNTIIILIFPIGFFIYKLWTAKTKKQYTFLSNLMKMIMLLGILTMIQF